MKQISVVTLSVLMLLLCNFFGQAQQSAATATNVPVPPLIQFFSVAADEDGNTLSGVVSITFSLYGGQQGGEPLWTETQNNVQLDSTGHYSVQLGITKQNGVPTTLFTTGEARWLGVRIAEQVEQPRVLLLSVPYALKAGDAATIGGLPPSAFVLAAPAGADAASAMPVATSAPQGAAPPSGTITGTGTVDFIPLWDSTSDIISSVLFQSGSGSTAKIGINTTTPASTLDIKGGSTVRGTLKLPATGAATATAGKNSQPLSQIASAFNSSSSTAVNQTFQWQAEPANNDTSTPSGTLNLLFGSGGMPTETGLNIASNGQITFATGQTFPGTGDGTVTSVGAGPGLTGGPITGSGILSIPTAGVINAMLAHPSLTVAAGTDLTGGGTVALGSTTTLNVDTTKVPQLNTANTFTGNQTVNGNLTATGVVSGSSYQIGSNLFAFGSYANLNAFLGFAGNPSSSNTGIASTASGYGALTSNTTGYYNTATGESALASNSTGDLNTATGASALQSNTTGNNNTGEGTSVLGFNTTGSDNTANGAGALQLNTTGSNNTAAGFEALIGNDTGSSNTAVGYDALGQSSSGCCNVAVGNYALQMVSTAQATTGVGNHAGATSDSTLVTGANNTALGTGTRFGTGTLTNATALGANAEVDASNSLVLGSINGVNGQTATVKVGIGTTTPSNVFTIASGAGKAISDGWSTYSSRRWKTKIQTLPDALAKVERLRGVSYNLKDSGKHEIGVIAEEVGAVVPEVVTYEENGTDARGVDY
ncbi:MAG: tail fiber domain-containing protein, partial [Candidatus Sulfotelmatobacter sp.]